MADKFTARAESALNRALIAASEMGHTYIGTEHLLIGLSREDCAASKILHAHSITSEDITDAVVEYAGTGLRSTPCPVDMTPRTRRVLESAHTAASRSLVGYIGTEHLLYSILEDKDCVASKLLQSLDANISEMKKQLLKILGNKITEEKKAKNTPLQESKLPEMYGKNLTEYAAAGKLDPVLTRDRETERLIHILCRRTKNNPCLIGEPGVGKTAVVEGLAQRIVSGEVPDILKGKTIFSLDISSMIAGAKFRGEFEERLKSMMELFMRDPSFILFIDEIHTIVGAGAAEGAVDAANILKPLLARGEISIIGATTLREYRRYIEKDAALERRFQPITVEEPSEHDSLQILLGLKERFERHHNVVIHDSALEAAVKLSRQYIPDRYLPDKAIDLIDEAAARVNLNAALPCPAYKETVSEYDSLNTEMENAVIAQDYERAAVLRDKTKECRLALERLSSVAQTPTVSENDIAEVITSWTGIPVGKLTRNEETQMAHLYNALTRRIVGQDNAIRAITDAIRRARTGVRDPMRPIGSFLFVGPTGVGKTALSRVLSEELYGRNDALIRLDMSEYKESTSVSKLIGSPPGYVGYEEGGQLTERVRRHPYSVILFDEIEKAHEDVYHVLLQILDDGILTDAQGRTVHFKNAVIILTSNLGATHLTGHHSAGFTGDAEYTLQVKEKNLLTDIKNFFRPEFINRLDDIIIFHPLNDDGREQIARTLTEETATRMEELGISLTVTDNAVTKLLDVGYDPHMGARPLKRTISRMLETPLADMMLAGKLKKGMSVIADASDNLTELTFTIS